jgi:hypothetical protein
VSSTQRISFRDQHSDTTTFGVWYDLPACARKPSSYTLSFTDNDGGCSKAVDIRWHLILPDHG